MYFQYCCVFLVVAPLVTALPQRNRRLLNEVVQSHHSFFGNIPSSHPKDSFHLPINSNGLNVTLRLRPNYALFTDDLTVEYHTKDGIQELHLEKTRFHAGTVVGVNNSSAVVHFRHDGHIESVIRIGDDKYHVEPTHRYTDKDSKDGDHVIFLEHHLNDEGLSDQFSCGHDYPELHVSNNGERVKVRQERSAHKEDIHSMGSDCRASNGKCSCAIALFADHLFVKSEYGENNPGVAAQYMVNQLAAADDIYRNTEFNGIRGYGLAAKKVTVYAEGSGPVSGDYYTAISLLEDFASARPAENACLGHLFTDRNFEGTLGLAYIGTLCSDLYNTGFHSIYGISTSVQQLTLSHEVGHSWGAEHDPDGTECAPDNSEGGRFLMYAAATDGSRKNNKQFSTCSIESISKIVYNQANCFSQGVAYCGNGIVESGEVCDCGAMCQEDSCCTEDCQINTDYGYTCVPQDPIRFPCCTPEDGSEDQCQYVPSDEIKLCDKADDCREDSYCDGSSAACPTAPARDDGTECACLGDDCEENPGTGSRVCYLGACSEWMCNLTGAERCSPMAHGCGLSCIGNGWGDGTECISSFDKDNRPSSINASGLYLGEGTPCDEYRGYCSARGHCYSVGSDLASRFRQGGSRFFARWGWTIFVGTLAVLLLQYGLRRIYRVKRLEGYEMIPASKEPLEYVVGRAKPDATYQTNEYISDTETETDLDEHVDFDSLETEYARQRAEVILGDFREKISRCTSQKALESLGQEIRNEIQNGAPLPEVGVQNLRKYYLERMNLLTGKPITQSTKREQLKDATFEMIDLTRKATVKAWDKTARKSKKAYKKLQRAIEKDSLDYVYY
eukprot:m.7120 g.7120  ORF g.7120 m.7120 type:complete len:843 (-) comp3648_c0_seq2:51-2579(-)